MAGIVGWGVTFRNSILNMLVVCLSRDGEDEVMGAWGVEDGSGWEAQAGSTRGETIFKGREEKR